MVLNKSGKLIGGAWFDGIDHKVLITCLQFLNNLISGNEKRKMSLWMHLFVPGSTRLLEAAKRKAVKQYQNAAAAAGNGAKDSPPGSSSKNVTPQDVMNYAKDLQLQEAFKNPPPAAKLSFVTMLPTILNAKEMLPLLLIIHGSITDIEGTDPARQLMRCKMMLAAEAGIGLMAGLLMFVDAWHEIDDHIYFELILEIMETILNNGLITYFFETLKEYVDCRNYQFEYVLPSMSTYPIRLRLTWCLQRNSCNHATAGSYSTSFAYYIRPRCSSNNLGPGSIHQL